MKNLLMHVVKEKAALQKKSSEKMVEELLCESLLPSSKDMVEIIKRHLYEDEGVRRTVSAIFQVNSSGSEWKAKYSNFFPLLKFCHEKQIYNFRLTGSEAMYLKNNLKLLLEHLKDDNEIQKLNDLMDIYDTVSEFNADKLYKFLIKNWERLKYWSVTYRVLYAVTSPMSALMEDAETRLKLLEILKRISSEWTL